MIFYVPKHYIKKDRERKEIQKIYYKDVTVCKFRTNIQKMVICGMMDEVCYEYNTMGNVNEKPSLEKHYDGIIKFYTVFDGKHDFIKIIEDNTPLKVGLENN